MSSTRIFCVAAVLALWVPQTGPSAAASAQDFETALQSFESILKGQTFEGRIVAARRAEVASQIKGSIKQLNFSAGDAVKAGQVVVELQDVAYRTVVRQAEARLQRLKEEYKLSKQRAERQTKLLERGSTPKAVEADTRANVAIARANLAEAEAAVSLAKLELAATRIVAPITGRIGPPRTSVGAYVEAIARLPIAEIVQVDPVWVAYEIPYEVYLKLRQATSLPISELFKRIEVRAVLPNGETYPHVGRPVSVDVKLQKQSEKLTTWASLPNPDAVLVFGLKVGVKLGISGSVPRSR